MFVANRNNGGAINVADRSLSKESLRRIREKERFFCPACSNELELKIGNVIKAHFAHKRMTSCSFNNEAESSYHLKGKRDLYDWLTEHFGKENVQLEPYINQIKQRPDILINYGNERIPIEFQCSSIESSLIIKRTKSYYHLHMNPFWILGAKMLTRSGAMSFLLSRFQWHFVQLFEGATPPKIYFYCSDSKAFIILHSIIPFSSRVVFARHQRYPITSYTIDQLNKQEEELKEIYAPWFEYVKRFRLKSSSYQTKEAAKLNAYLYKQKQIPLAYLPSVAFLPLRTSYLIESPIYVWQGWLLLYIDSLRVQHCFSFQSICSFIEQKVRKKEIKIRRLEQIKLHYTYVIKEYLNKLLYFTIIEKKPNNIYVKRNPINWQNGLEQLFVEDQVVLKAVNKNFQ